jgi:hypothetical protein
MEIRKILWIVSLLILLIGCATEEVPLEKPVEGMEEPVVQGVSEEIVEEVPVIEEAPETKMEKIEEEQLVKIIEEVKEVEPTLINGKTVEERLKKAYDNLHSVGSEKHIRENFLDIELVYTDNPTNYPKEILPFEYYYSAEANVTFNICAIERTVFICEGKLDQTITDDILNSDKCVVTPIYQNN